MASKAKIRRKRLRKYSKEDPDHAVEIAEHSINELVQANVDYLKVSLRWKNFDSENKYFAVRHIEDRGLKVSDALDSLAQEIERLNSLVKDATDEAIKANTRLELIDPSYHMETSDKKFINIKRIMDNQNRKKE